MVVVFYKFFDDIQFCVEGEIGCVEKKIYFINYFDQVFFWDCIMMYDGIMFIVDMQVVGVNMFSFMFYYVFIFGVLQVGYSDWFIFYCINGFGFVFDIVLCIGLVNLFVFFKCEFNFGLFDFDVMVCYYSFIVWFDYCFIECF